MFGYLHFSCIHCSLNFQMLMMCGLPGAGKTHWVREHIKNNPEKLYNVFGVFSLTGKMKVRAIKPQYTCCTYTYTRTTLTYTFFFSS